MYTIDASVYINASDPREAGHEISEQLLNLIRLRNIALVEPTLLITEVAAAIGRGRGDAELANQLAQRISQLPNISFVNLSVATALGVCNDSCRAASAGSRCRLCGCGIERPDYLDNT
jgi:predicted nucleic acid-binding protein